MPGVDNAGVIRVAIEVRVHPGAVFAYGCREPVDLALWAVHVVGSQAKLTRVHRFAKANALGGDLQIGIRTNDRRRLAAQLQGYRRQVFRGCAHDFAADIGRTGEQQVVERQADKLARGFHAPGHHRNLVGRKGLFEHEPGCRGCMRRDFRQFQQHAVTGRQRV